ncbi:MAG: CoA transferase subunit A [Dehalococcoidia bacterium]
MPVDKVYPSCAEAVADIPDGATIMSGGFGGGGVPTHLLLALRDQGTKGLTVIANSTGLGEKVAKKIGRPAISDVAVLVENGQIRKAIASIPVSLSPSFPSEFEKLLLQGKVEVEALPQGTMCERMRIAAAGLGGFYTPTGVGTKVEEGKEKRVFDGQEYILEKPLRADYALINAHKADRMGNLVYKGTSRNFSPLMAAAARVTIVQAENIVEIGELDPGEIITPGVYVDRIVQVPCSD